MDSVYAEFERTARRHGAKPFLHVAGFTYAESREKAGALAARYQARGYGKGHRVALKLGNRPEFLLHFLALNALGASIVPLNPDYRAAELEYVLQHSQACLVVDDALDRDLAALPRAPAPGDAAKC